MKNQLSVFIITLNEESCIQTCLSALSQVAEIIVVDSGSTDKTIEIAKSMGAHVIHHSWSGFAEQKQFALSQCHHEWALNLDADEIVDDAFLSEIDRLITINKYDGVEFVRHDVFINRTPSSLAKNKKHCRLFRASKAHYDPEKLVHEEVILEGNIFSSNASFIHLGYNKISVLVNKFNRYSSLKAEEKFHSGRHASLSRLLYIFPFEFIKEYLLRGKLFSGKRGFILSVLEAHYAFLKEAKLFEKEENERNN